MGRRRGWILVALGLTLAFGTGALVYVLLQQAAPAAAVNVTPPPTTIPTKLIPVAARPLDVGVILTDTDIVLREAPLDLPLVGVLTDTATLAGQTVIAPVQEGEFFRPAQLHGGDLGPLSAQIEERKVVVAFTSEDLLNKSKVIHEGDHVDLLLTVEVEEETATETRAGKSTNLTLQNVKVFRIVQDAPTEQNPKPEPSAVLFEMAPQDAVIAKFVKDSGGVIDFALRSPLDQDLFTTEMINNDYLFDTYGFRAPRSSSRPKQQ